MKKSALFLILVCSLSIVASGCTMPVGIVPQSSDIIAMNTEASEGTYVIGAGDVLAIKFFYNDRLNEEVTVRPDGRISLQLIGDMQAAGFSPAQLSADLTARYAEVLRSAGGNHVLGVGDTVTVKFFYNDNLNDAVTVRQDGRISLQLIDDIEAAGLTVDKLRERLVESYSGIIASPKITVSVSSYKTPVATAIVKEFASNKLYVGGEVANPGLIPMQGRTTALGAVIQAGGPKRTAKQDNIILVRYSTSQQPKVYTIDLDKIIKGEIQDVILRPYDVIYVPQTAIAKIDLFVEQYVYKIIPLNVMFGFHYYLNSTKVDTTN